MNTDLYSRLFAVAAELDRQVNDTNVAELRSLDEARERLARQKEGLRRYLLTRDILSAPANAN